MATTRELLEGCRADRRLLEGEMRRALAKLAAVRELASELLDEEVIGISEYNRLIRIARFSDDEG